MIKKHRSKRGKIPSTSQVLNEAADRLEATGKKVLRMHIGAPSTGAPKRAIEAAMKAEQEKILGYTSALGMRPLRERIAKHYDEVYGVKVDPERVVVTIGASLGLIVGAIACLDRGGRFALPYPVYPAYQHTLEMLDIDVVPIETTMDTHFQPTVDNLKQCKQPFDALIVASPSNPVGATLPNESLQGLVEYCDDQNIQLFSDEIYHGIVYSREKLQTALKYSDNVVVMNSFSKYYSMPGWRVGWMVVPEDLAHACGSIIRNLYLSTPTPSQFAALAAMDCRKELDEHVERYRKNRELLLKGLPEAGFDRFIAPEGAFYVYVHVAHLHHDSHAFCHEMLEEIGIAAMPGTDFDPHHGHHYVRFSFAGSTEDVKEAIERLQSWR